MKENKYGAKVIIGILALIVLALVIMLTMPVDCAIRAEFQCKRKIICIIIEAIGDSFLQIVAIFIAVIAVIISIRSLSFSKRSSLVKDSYVPILEEIQKNSKVDSKQGNDLFDFRELKVLQNSYLYSAFERKEQSLIRKITELEVKVNNNKEKVHSNTIPFIIEELNSEFEAHRKPKSFEIINLLISTSQGNSANGSEFYNLLHKQSLLAVSLIDERKLNVRYGYNFTNYSHRFKDSDSKGEKSLVEYFEENLDLKYTKRDELGECFISNNITEIDKQLLKKFQQDPLYELYIKQHQELKSEMYELEEVITERVHKLLIPGYWWRKYLPRFKKDSE